jgi:hypothetical protein
MKKQTRRAGELWLLSTDKGGLSRDAIGDIQKRVGRYQRDAGLLAYYIRVLESRPNTHAHIVFIGDADVAARLKRAQFGGLIDVTRVTDPDGLSKKYLAKERTPQAGFKRTDLGGRIKGSHRLEDGGDRVVLSRELERDAIEAGLVEPWQHTNAKRSSVRKKYRPRRISKRALRPAGQMLLFPELEKPVSRLHEFGGGPMPPAVALETEFMRRRRGLSQRRLACLIGRSQSQYANAIRGHDPISAISVNRLRDVLLTQMEIAA